MVEQNITDHFSREVCPKDSEFWMRGSEKGYEIGQKGSKDVTLTLGTFPGQYVYAALRGQERIEKHPLSTQLFKEKEFVSTHGEMGTAKGGDNLPLDTNREQNCIVAVIGMLETLSLRAGVGEELINPTEKALLNVLSQKSDTLQEIKITRSAPTSFEFCHDLVVLGPVTHGLQQVICFEKVAKNLPWRLASLATVYEMYNAVPSEDMRTRWTICPLRRA